MVSRCTAINMTFFCLKNIYYFFFVYIHMCILTKFQVRIKAYAINHLLAFFKQSIGKQVDSHGNYYWYYSRPTGLKPQPWRFQMMASGVKASAMKSDIMSISSNYTVTNITFEMSIKCDQGSCIWFNFLGNWKKILESQKKKSIMPIGQLVQKVLDHGTIHLNIYV